MQEKAEDLSSPAIKSYYNTLKELKIVLNRKDCLIKSDVIGLNKYKVRKNVNNPKGIQGIDNKKKKLRTWTKVSYKDKNTFQDEDISYDSSTDSEASAVKVSQQLYTNNKTDTAYCCEVCTDTFQTMKALNLHSRFHIKFNGGKFTCALCRDTFKTNNELINHKLVHDSEDHCFMCKKCKLAFTSHHDYLQHNARHVKTPLYKCIECSYTFHLRKSYKNHISIHYLKQLKCNLCQETFTKRNELMRHKRCYHLPGIDCVECGKNFSTRRDHEEHMVSHTGVKVFQCLYCGMGFSRHGGKSIHTRKMHTKFIPHECTVCSGRYHSTAALKVHMITHEREKKYECNDCGQQFFHRNSMIQHVRRHMNYMLYKCPMCECSYTTYQNLCEHTEVAHVKIRRYKCELCNASFILKRFLRKHLRSRNHQNKFYAAHKHLMNDEK